MISYPQRAFASKNILAQAQQDLATVRSLLEMLPEANFQSQLEGVKGSGLGATFNGKPSPEWTCHALVRMVQPQLILKWQVRDGRFLKNGSDHSWLFFQQSPARLLLDVYPVASLVGPLLIDLDSYEWRTIYTRSIYTAADVATFEQEAAIARALLNLAPTKEKPA